LKYYKKQTKTMSTTQEDNYYAALEDNEEETVGIETELDTEEEMQPMNFLVEKAKKKKSTRNLNIPIDEETSWETVGARQCQKEHKLVHEVKSGRYLPYNMPEYDNDDDMVQKTKVVLPLTIKINPPRGRDNKRFEYKNARILSATIKAFQMIESETYVGTLLDDDPDYPILHRAFEIPLEEEYLAKYMEEPTVGKDKSYTVRVYMHTNYQLEHFKQNLKFMNYLKDSNIQIDYNDLDTVNPVTVGFMENIIPRHDTVLLYQEN
jgi:hypothetical protein